MPPLPRGTCPVCHRSVALRKGGLVREHTRAPIDSDRPWRKCEGSGKKAKGAS